MALALPGMRSTEGNSVGAGATWEPQSVDMCTGSILAAFLVAVAKCVTGEDVCLYACCYCLENISSLFDYVYYMVFVGCTSKSRYLQRLQVVDPWNWR